MTKEIKREPFDGKAGEMRDSPWLASEDLKRINSIDLVIANVYINRDVEFEGGRSKEVVYFLEFSKAKRQLVLNGFNRKTLVSLHGADVKNWIGKTVTVYVEEGIKIGRDMKGSPISSIIGFILILAMLVGFFIKEDFGTEGLIAGVIVGAAYLGIKDPRTPK